MQASAARRTTAAVKASAARMTAGAYGADLTYIPGFGRSYAHEILI